MAPLKSFLLVSSGLASSLTCSHDNCEAGDQTALLQSHLTRKSELSLTSTQSAFFPKLGNLNDPHTRKSALLEVQKTAIKLASMDRSEVTDVVVEVCTDTANMLNETVLYAIIEEDAVDRASLEAAYAAFTSENLQQHYENALAAITQGEALVAQTALAVTECHTSLSQYCETWEECEHDEHDECEECETCNNCAVTDSLCSLDHEIHQRWCTGDYQIAALRTATTEDGIEWRTGTKTIFERYQTAVDSCNDVCTSCATTTEICVHIHTNVTTQNVECNTAHHNWMAAKCTTQSTLSTALQLYQQGYIQTLGSYNDIVARVMIEEADRKVEWEVLTRVICLLLTLTNTEDGAAASTQNEMMIQSCYDNPVDTTHLDIDYLAPPDMLTVPVLPPLPCDADVMNDEMYGIPAVCEAAFIGGVVSAASATCPCPEAQALVGPLLVLGHYLLVDPAIDVHIQGTQWTSVMSDGTTYVGVISALHTESMPTLTSGFFTEEEVNALPNGGIAAVAWAYGSHNFEVNGADGLPLPMTLEQRFARNGGMIYMDSADAVLAVRELAASSSSMGQDLTAYMSFEPAHTITEDEFSTACGTGQDVSDEWQLSIGAEKYCWNQGTLAGAGWSCTNGCFVYKTTAGNMAFPLIANSAISD